jgi:hypothetical protein
MTSPFRALAVVPDYPPPLNPHRRDGNGTRDCDPPGVWRRFVGGYRRGDRWTCDCGQEWAWLKDRNYPYEMAWFKS